MPIDWTGDCSLRKNNTYKELNTDKITETKNDCNLKYS